MAIWEVDTEFEGKAKHSNKLTFYDFKIILVETHKLNVSNTRATYP